MTVFEKIQSFLAESSAAELAVLAVALVIPIIALVLLIVSLARLGKDRREAREDAAVSLADERAFEESRVAGAGGRELPIREDCPKKSVSNERCVERVRVKVQVRKLNRVDKELLAATGIFCVGLGFMLRSAIQKKK